MASPPPGNPKSQLLARVAIADQDLQVATGPATHRSSAPAGCVRVVGPRSLCDATATQQTGCRLLLPSARCPWLHPVLMPSCGPSRTLPDHRVRVAAGYAHPGWRHPGGLAGLTVCCVHRDMNPVMHTLQGIR